MNTIETEELYEDAAIIVHEVYEHEDGSATLKLDIRPRAMTMLVELGLISLFSQYEKGRE